VVAAVRAGGLASLLEGEEGATAGFENLHAFGLLDHTLSADLLLGSTYEILARAMHEEYVRQQEAEGHTPETKPAMVPWEELREDFKESNRRQARHIGVKLKAVGCGIAPLTDWEAESFRFTDREMERLAEMEHDRWMEEKRREGWIYAPERDDMKKRSPYLLPWNELPDKVKEWDRAFIRGLPRFLAGVGFQIIRLGQREEGEAERTD
jgi:hypothetical protein